MQFKDIIGQVDVKHQLIQMIQQNRLSHALLFLGKEGSGALSLARAFTQYLVCEKINGKSLNTGSDSGLFADDSNEAKENNADKNDSCGVCSACIKSAKMIHPDIHYSYPVISRKSGDKPISTDFINEWRTFIDSNPYGNSYDWLQSIGAENKQGNITVHECGDINRKLSLKSFESTYKFLIMWMPELLGLQGNRLLKLIEEPPPNTVFIFVAENDQQILQTILSRTQLIKIPLLKRIDIEAALELREGIAVQKADQIARVSEGNYHEALQQLQHADNDWEILLREWLNSILKTGPVAQVKWIEDISKIGREKQKQFFKYFIHLLEDAIKLNMITSEDQESATISTSNDFAIRLNKLCNINQQEAIIKELDAASYHIERNANAKLLFHALTIKLYHIISNNAVILVN